MAYKLKQEMIKAMRSHAEGHINKHKMNVEVYLENPAGIGEHPDVFEAMESEIMEMAKYQDVIDMIDKYFTEEVYNITVGDLGDVYTGEDVTLDDLDDTTLTFDLDE